MKRGIIQSRGLGDILIALPIAWHYHQRGDEIHWPICQEFLPSFVEAAPWVHWHGIATDSRGEFFVEAPMRVFKANGVESQGIMYLYHYLNTQPQMTNPELFNILKFDQYKYAVADVPFKTKWDLAQCVTRDPAAELAFKQSLDLPERYNVVHLKGSSMEVEVKAVGSILDPAVPVVEITEISNSIWDWLAVIEGAENVVCIDSVFANLIDQMGVAGPKLYWIRRSSWDLTPVLGLPWTVVPTTLPIVVPTRVDPAVEARLLKERLAAQSSDGRPQPNLRPATAPGSGSTGLASHVPFKAAGNIPTSFMSALKK